MPLELTTRSLLSFFIHSSWLVLQNKSTTTEAMPMPTSPPSDDDETLTFEEAQKIRLERIQKVCATPGRQIGFVSTLIGTARSNLTYCMTPRSELIASIIMYKKHREFFFLLVFFPQENPCHTSIHDCRLRRFRKL